MSVDFAKRVSHPSINLKPKRVPLSNITNTLNARAILSKHQEPCYSFRMYQSKQLNVQTSTLKQNEKVKSTEHKGRKISQSRVVLKSKPEHKLSKSNVKQKDYGSMRETIQSLKSEVGLLNSKSQAMEQLHKMLCDQVRKMQDTSRVTKFVKDQTSRKLRVLDNMSQENSKVLKSLLKQSTKSSNKVQSIR